MSNTVHTIDQHQGRKLNIAGGDYRIIVSGKETNGTYAIIEMTVPAGAGPVPHAHPGFEEIFYVVEGEVDFKTAAGSFLAQKGATVSIPKGGPIHNFKNNADQPAKLLCTVLPAGLDSFFVEVEDFIQSNQDKPVDLKQNLKLIAEKYGQQIYPPNYWDL